MTSTDRTDDNRTVLDSWDYLQSPKTPAVKLFRALASKRKKRAKEGITVVEGLRLVTDLLGDSRTRGFFRHVLVTEGALNHPDYGGKLMDGLVKMTDDAGGAARISLGSEEVVSAACDTVTPQGVVASISIPDPYVGPEAEGGSSATENGTGRTYLVLDGLADPGNVGTLLRTSLACSVSAVLLISNSCDVFNPKALRGAMGSAFRVPVRRVDSFDECLELLGRWGVDSGRVYAATMDGSEGGGKLSLPYHDINWISKSTDISATGVTAGSALILGKEGEGLSFAVREAVRSGQIRAVHVPMAEGVESLNAAVCGSVILFEGLKQRKEYHTGKERES